MSNEIFGMSADHMGNMNGPLSSGGLPLASGYPSDSTASPETPNPCYSTSPSYLGDLDGNSSADDYVLAYSAMDSHVESPCLKLNMLSKVRMNLHEACFTPPVSDLVNALNQSISLMGSAEMTSLEGKYRNKNSGDGGDDQRARRSLESTEGPSALEAREASRRRSSENNCSFSSGEFVMRSNSFILEEEVLPVSMSQDELFMSPLSLLQDKRLGLQDKKYTEGFTVEEANPAYFDMMKWHLAEKEKLNTEHDLHVTLPIEMELDFLSTFLSDSVNVEADEVAPPSAEASAAVGKPSNLNATFVASQQMNCTTFVDPTAEGHDYAPKAQTSTPLLHLGNSFSLLSFSGSPFSGSTDSPTLCPQGPHIPTKLKPQRVARLSSISGKAVKTDIRTFPKPDYSGVKSRIMTRLSHQLATPAKSMLPQSSKMNGCAKPSQVNLKALNKVATAKLPHTAAAVSRTTASIGVPKEENAVTGDMQKASSQSDGGDVSAATPSQHGPLSINEDAEGVSKGSMRNSLGTGSEDATSALGAELSPCSVQAASGKDVTSPPTRPPFNVTFCSSLPLQAPDKNDDPEPSTEVSHRNGVGSGSPLAIMRAVDNLTSQHGPSREKRRTSSSSVFNLGSTTQTSGSPRSGNLSNKQDEEAGVEMETPEGTSREFRKISLVAESPTSKVADASGSTCDQSKSGPAGRPSPRQSRVLSRTTALSPGPKPLPISSRRRQQGTSGAVQRATDLLQLKKRNPAAHPKALTTDKPTMGAPDTRTKSATNGVRPLQTTSRPLPATPAHTPVSKVPPKAPGTSRGTVLKAGEQSDRSRGTTVSAVAPLRSSSFRTVVLKTRLLAKSPGDPAPTLATSCKSAASIKPGSARSLVNPLRRTESSRIAQLASSLPAEKSKAKASSRQPQQPQPQQRGPPKGPSAGGRVPVPGPVGGDGQSKRNDHVLRRLRELLATGNRKFEAIAVVLQRTLTERDEAVRRRRELSQELVNLQGELVCSATSCERLAKEKEEVRASLADALRRLEEQHRDELAHLEARLQAFYQAEWDKVHRTYQEEADKCRTLMEQQIGDLNATNEATKLELKADHFEHVQDVKRQYEDSLEELRKIQSEEQQALEKTLKEVETTLSGQIRELTEDNNTLVEKLKAEEERRKQLAGKSQDSHTLYLEQELESLKVVLDIKNKQLHQQEKKLLQMDTVVEKSAKLEESLIKVQQENEDLKARMDRHAALSRQLSTEQAVLHQSLKKESKVNKRLSMENEELLWKLHNGELGSPRRLSPTSPSHANSFQSPRSSALFSSPPLSPR